MNKIFKAAVIGGGASGLLAAVELLSGKDALRGDDVVVLERNDRVGKKLTATGNGQGNLSNSDISSDNYSDDPVFISKFIEQLKFNDPIKYLNNLGIVTENDESGRIYPVSRQASSVLDIIRNYLSSKNCTVVTNYRAVKIEKKNRFVITSENGEKTEAEYVILAAGGKAAKQFGTDGSAYSLATGFGHSLTPLYPSLVQLKTDKDKIKGLKGIKHNVILTLSDGNNVVKSATGDLLFTEYGVSGNSVFKVSDKVLTIKNPTLTIDFTPNISENDLKTILIKRLKSGFFPQSELLNGIVHKKLGEKIAAFCGNDVIKITKTVKSFTLRVCGTLGFDYAQTTKGGVKTKEIDAETYESKLRKNLFIIGEMLDIDGECGGYNLTFAFVSGITAAKAVKNKCKNKSQKGEYNEI